MKSSKPSHVKIEQVEVLVQKFEDAIIQVLNTVDNLAKLNTETKHGGKYIDSAKFRMHIRSLRVEINKELKSEMTVTPDDNPPEPPNVA